MPRDIDGTIIDRVSSTSISCYAATLRCDHVHSTTACRAALLLTALGTNFRDARDGTSSSLSTAKYPSLASAPFGESQSEAHFFHIHESSLVLSVLSAKCNAIRHAKDNFFSPLSFDDDAVVHRCTAVRFLIATRVFSEIVATRDCTVNLRASDEFPKKEFVEEKFLHHYLLAQCDTKRRNTVAFVASTRRL